MDLTSYNRQGQVFVAANVSAKSVIAVTTAMTGVVLFNPVGSGKDLLIIDAGFVWTTAPAAVHNIGIAIGPQTTVPTSTTAIGSGVQIANGTGNAASSRTLAYDAATLAVAPVAVRWFGGNLYQAASAVGTTIAGYNLTDHVDGAIRLVPGSVACLTVVTTTAVGMGHFTWIETPNVPGV